jgi:hypothetical protein
MLLRSPLSSRPDASPRAALLSLTRSRAPSCCCLARHGRTHAHGRHVRAHAADIGSGDGEACHDGRAHALHMARHATPPRGGARALTWCRHASCQRACVRTIGPRRGVTCRLSALPSPRARGGARAPGPTREHAAGRGRGARRRRGELAGRPACASFPGAPAGASHARAHASSATPCFIRLRCRYASALQMGTNPRPDKGKF